MRIFTTSDIHIDFKPNREWMIHLSREDYQQDCLILAGDISDKEEYLQLCFSTLVKVFKHVLFVPGNHDLWVKKTRWNNSLDKFYAINQMAEHAGIQTSPLHLPQVSIIPLYSWYDFSFGPCDEYLQQRWMDFIHCEWGDSFAELNPYQEQAAAINDFFLSLNESRLSVQADKIISFSHFLPRIDVMPHYIPEIHQKLYPILGTEKLDQQIQKLGSACHIYGHSHVNRDVELDGIRYVNNAFGYPAEQRISRKQLLLIDEL
ncbi:MAG: metallophosphoesterase family protein [Pseudomonadales bacterium]|nr:metallophosphoesterase family protein [Pseudomonadales bacterium]